MYLQVLETSIVYELFDDSDSPDAEFPLTKPHISATSQQSGSVGSYSSSCSDSTCRDGVTSLRIKGGSRKWSAGFYPELCCLLQWVDGEPPSPITSLSFSSSYGL